ncbi:MAG: Phosphate acyltransferase [Elusimicrobia bacterium ADurb.Bin231]|nr:MAG: Phosphate acyltransferase [Elusimicrobia bacterium ADurb.Bin231]
MKIVVDAMGGDYAPAVVAAGAVDAAKEYGHEILLIGDKKLVSAELNKYNSAGLPISIIHASEVVEMSDSAAGSLRSKPNSSIAQGIKLLAEKKADGFFSAGHSGAVGASALITLKRIKGVSRPAIATVFPTLNAPCVLVDAGVNVDSKPKNLFQFAVMGSLYSKYIFGIKNPAVGLLSIGKEETKGNELTLETYKLLKNSDLNFVGNIEGGDIVRGEINVVVCDGFTGNIVLKLGEGVAQLLISLIKNEMKKNPIKVMAAYLLLRGVFKNIKKKIDYDEYGGAPLLGVNGVCFIGHGSSNAKAIKNGIRVTANAVKNNINGHIEEELKKLGENNGD